MRAPTTSNKKHPCSSSSPTVSREQLMRAYRQMMRARLGDEKIIVLYKQNKCHFEIGCAGQEAVQVAAADVFKAGQDWFYPYYRDIAFCAALGFSDQDFMLNALNKRDDPNSHGREMPMHWGHKDMHVINQSSPTGSQLLQAVGCALGLKRQKKNDVVYVSIGEGACSQGDFHEALNWAARERLAVIFLVQNNAYAISVHVSEQLAGGCVAKIARGYEGLEVHEIDGTDYVASFQVIKGAYERAKGGLGPALIEAHVPRLASHSISDNQAKYRSVEELEAEKKRCPLLKMRNYLLEHELATPSELDDIEKEVKASIDHAAEWAEAQLDCDPATALNHNYIEPDPGAGIPESVPSGEPVFMVDALNQALDEELSLNPNVYVFGQDVAGEKGGVFSVTSGLTKKYGPERVFNAPLAESSIAGVAGGMAMLGLKPVAEIQFGDYVWTAMNQIRSELAMICYRSGGEFPCPVVLRIPVGGYIHGACYHSQNIEATFAHFPGLFIIYPSNATDAKGLLKSAIRAKDPVLFLEHKGLYRQVFSKGPVGGKDFVLPIGRARIVRAGSDATIVTWGALVHKSLLAAEELERQGRSVEIIDLRTIVPPDMQCIFESVKKTNRVLVAHEDVQFMGFGAELAAQIAEQCFTYLEAPVKRLGMKYAAAVPHSPVLENAVLPQNEDVLRALTELLDF